MVCKALNFNTKDEIITVSNSFIATCGAILSLDVKACISRYRRDNEYGYRSIRKNNKIRKAVMPISLSFVPAKIERNKKFISIN